MPYEGYTFSGWYGDALGTTFSTHVKVDKDVIAAAAFEKSSKIQDADNDGLTDFYESVIGSNPVDRDTDGDLINDGDEVFHFGSNPTSLDSDGDGRPDMMEYVYKGNLTNPEEYPYMLLGKLTRHYSMDNGRAMDSSPNRAHIKPANTVPAIDRLGEENGALTFNGENSYLRMTRYFGEEGSSGRGYSCWVKTSAGNPGCIFSTGQEPGIFNCYVGEHGRLEVRCNGATLIGSTVIADDNWHYFTVSLPEGGRIADIKICINGQLEEFSGTTGGISQVVNTIKSDTECFIGKSQLDDHFTGDLDEFRCWSRYFAPFECFRLHRSESEPQVVLAKPVISEHPVNSVCRLGEPATLSYTVDYQGTAIYVWQRKVGQTWEVILGQDTTTFTIPSTTDEDQLLYRGGCMTPDGRCLWSAPVWIYVLNTPSILEQPEDAAFLAGKGGRLEAKATGSKPLIWEWFKDGVSLGTTQNQYYNIPRGSTQHQHGGTYNFKVINSVGEMTSDPFNISILDPITITQHPVHTGILEGEAGRLFIEASGGGTLTYQWVKYNTITRRAEEIEGLTSPAWEITPMAANLVGTYACIVSCRAVKIRSRWADLSMYEAPVITKQPENAEVEQ